MKTYFTSFTVYIALLNNIIKSLLNSPYTNAAHTCSAY